jgi:hypothetical protein
MTETTTRKENLTPEEREIVSILSSRYQDKLTMIEDLCGIIFVQDQEYGLSLFQKTLLWLNVFRNINVDGPLLTGESKLHKEQKQIVDAIIASDLHKHYTKEVSNNLHGHEASRSLFHFMSLIEKEVPGSACILFEEAIERNFEDSHTVLHLNSLTSPCKIKSFKNKEDAIKVILANPTLFSEIVSIIKHEANTLYERVLTIIRECDEETAAMIFMVLLQYVEKHTKQQCEKNGLTLGDILAFFTGTGEINN